MDKKTLEQALIPRLLIVDDNPQNLQVLGRLLQEINYEIEFATNGKAALEWLEHLMFDLVLLDVNMPDIDGFSVLEKMREIPELAGMPVIMVTGVVDSQSVFRGKKLQVSDYLVKPYRIADLLKRVDRCLNVSLDLTFEELPTTDEAASLFDETAAVKDSRDQR